MAVLGADYSWARPGGTALHAAGVAAVGRYLATDGRGITAAEYKDLTAHGVGVWLVREGAASGMLRGFTQGAADARIAQQCITAAGLPADSLVHAAADWDVTTAQFAACDDYLRGFNSVVGVDRTGIYGGLHYLNHAHSLGLAVSFWQAGATSWNHGETPQMPINYQQTTLTPPLPGTDHNYIYSLTPLEDDMTPEEHTMLKAVHDAVFVGGDSMPDAGRSIGQSLQGLTNRVSGIGDLVEQPVPRDGQTLSQAQDNMNTGTLVRHLAQNGVPVDVNAVATAVAALLPAGALTQEQVKQAVIDGVSALTIKATA